MAERDPLIGARFALEVDGVVLGWFAAASGFNNKSEVIVEQSVGPDGKAILKKIPGTLSYDDLTLSRGISDDKALWDWRQEIINGQVDKGARRDGSVILYNHAMEEKARFNFYNGWPSSWKGPDVKADDNSVAVEEVSIAHERLERKN